MSNLASRKQLRKAAKQILLHSQELGTQPDRPPFIKVDKDAGPLVDVLFQGDDWRTYFAFQILRSLTSSDGEEDELEVYHPRTQEFIMGWFNRNPVSAMIYMDQVIETQPEEQIESTLRLIEMGMTMEILEVASNVIEKLDDRITETKDK